MARKKSITKIEPVENIDKLNRNVFYVVKPGDTIQSIASMFHVSVQEIVAINGSSIHVGKPIRIY